MIQTGRMRAVLLLLTVALVAGASLALASGDAPQPESVQAPVGAVRYPGNYIAGDFFNVDRASYGLTGGLLTVNWAFIEDEVPGQYDWSYVDTYLAEAGAKSKLVGVMFTTYNGWPNGGVVNAMPRYLWDTDNPNYTPGALVDAGEWRCADNPDKQGCISGHWYFPRYWSSVYLQRYEAFVQAFAERYKHDPRIEWVAVGAGLYGEINAVDDLDGVSCPGWGTRPYLECKMIEAINTDKANGGVFCDPSCGGPQDVWMAFVKRLVDTYATAFSTSGRTQGTQALSKVVFVQTATFTFSAEERRDIAAYAASKGVGLSLNGLYPDQLFTYVPGSQTGLYDQLALHGDEVPVAFETYDYMIGCDGDKQVYWAYMNALDKHTDYLRLNVDLFFPYNEETGEFDFNSPKWDNINIFKKWEHYLGRTVDDAPGVFVALREHRGPWITCWNGGPTDGQRENTYFPEYGDYEYWLYHDRSVAGGCSVPETVDPTVDFMGNPYEKNQPGCTTFNENPYNPRLPNTKESWVTRRTDQDSGNPYMYFNIDDKYLFDVQPGTTVTVTVTYLDDAGDTWVLEYDSREGRKAATPVGGTGPFVQNSDPPPTGLGGGSWQQAVFVLTDARFANGLYGGNDLRLYSNGDGDNWFHMVYVTKGTSAGTPTPTPWPSPTFTATPTPTGTATPSTATIIGRVFNDRNQNGELDPGEPGVSGATLLLLLNGSVPSGQQVSNADGSYAFADLAPGFYLLRETAPLGYTYTTSRVWSGVVAAGQTTVVNFGLYKEQAGPTETPTPTRTATPTWTATPTLTVTATPTPTRPANLNERMYVPIILH